MSPYLLPGSLSELQMLLSESQLLNFNCGIAKIQAIHLRTFTVSFVMCVLQTGSL